MNHSCIKQDPFRKSRLSRINVCADPNVARTLQREITVGGIWIIGHGEKKQLNYQRK